MIEPGQNRALPPPDRVELEHLRSRVSELEMMLEVARSEVEHADRARKALTDVLLLASHEMRSPLGALRLQLDRLGRKIRWEQGSDESQLTRFCLRSMRRLNDMVETLMGYARTQALPLEIHSEAFNLALLVRDVAADVDVGNGKRCPILIDVKEPLPVLRSDATLVRLTLLHLLLHQSAHHPSSEVAISLSEAKGEHCVSVSVPAEADRESANGEPLDPSTVDPMLEAWPPGSKLAFILVREMITALGGRVEVQSEAGGFGMVTLTIPSLPECT